MRSKIFGVLSFQGEDLEQCRKAYNALKEKESHFKLKENNSIPIILFKNPFKDEKELQNRLYSDTNYVFTNKVGGDRDMQWFYYMAFAPVWDDENMKCAFMTKWEVPYDEICAFSEEFPYVTIKVETINDEFFSLYRPEYVSFYQNGEKISDLERYFVNEEKEKDRLLSIDDFLDREWDARIEAGIELNDYSPFREITATDYNILRDIMQNGIGSADDEETKMFELLNATHKSNENNSNKEQIDLPL